MPYSTFEDILSNIETWIGSNFSTFINEINTEKADEITLKDFKEIIIGLSDMYNSKKYPILCIVPENIPIEPLSLGTDDIQEIVNFIIADVEGDAEKGYKKQMRYAAAFRNMCLDDKTAGDSVDLITVTNVDPYPPDTDKIIVVIIQAEIHKEVSR